MSEKLAAKMAAVNAAMADIRRVVRQNGAPVGPDTDIREVARQALNIKTENVMARWKDISILDQIKSILHSRPGVTKPELTTAELMQRPTEDAELTAERKSWAVLRVTKAGTEIVTCGGAYYQQYLPVMEEQEVTEEREITEPVIDPETGLETGETRTVTEMVVTGTVFVPTGEYTRGGEEKWLEKQLMRLGYSANARNWEVALHKGLPTYTEGDQEYYVVPCDLPTDVMRLYSLRIDRNETVGNYLGAHNTLLGSDRLSGKLDDSNPGMIGISGAPSLGQLWYIYDNSELESAPVGMLIPKIKVDSGWVRLRITYSAVDDPLGRLRLVGDSFGEEYIISTQDLGKTQKGTWLE